MEIISKKEDIKLVVQILLQVLGEKERECWGKCKHDFHLAALIALCFC